MKPDSALTAWDAMLAQLGMTPMQRRRARQRESWARRVRSESEAARAARLARRRSSPAEREARRRWKAANRERVAAYMRAWRAANVERLRVYEERENARRAADRPVRLEAGADFHPAHAGEPRRGPRPGFSSRSPSVALSLGLEGRT